MSITASVEISLDTLPIPVASLADLFLYMWVSLSIVIVFKMFIIQIFIAIFGFSMKNTFKWVQTSLVLVKFPLRLLLMQLPENIWHLRLFSSQTEGSLHNYLYATCKSKMSFSHMFPVDNPTNLPTVICIPSTNDGCKLLEMVCHHYSHKLSTKMEVNQQTNPSLKFTLVGISSLWSRLTTNSNLQFWNTSFYIHKSPVESPIHYLPSVIGFIGDSNLLRVKFTFKANFESLCNFVANFILTV